ncbi:hypothetical protein CLOP_g23567 [Closterium sp. NIES-67]|nr:hypothetical protein CLOP_g23567 [Closterium sp. NIES-67]
MRPRDLAICTEKCRELLAAGLISPSTSDYAAATVIVACTDLAGEVVSHRMYYRGLNKVTVADKYPTPMADEIFARLHSARIFSTLDLRQGFNQVLVAEEDMRRSAFHGADGLYEWNHVPLGLRNASIVFQRTMDVALRGVAAAACCIDDVIVFRENEEAHMRDVEQSDNSALGSHGIFKIRTAVRILADKNGGRFRSQNGLPNSIRIVRVSGDADRTHQHTFNVPSRDESHPTPTLGQMHGSVPGRHSRLLTPHATTRQTLTTRLRDNRRERFYVKLSKSNFALEKVQFLGHIVSAQGVHVDPKKIEAVRTWKTLENVKELQQFLGFANYYNRFMPQYAKIAAPLTNLLKKNTPYKWEPKHQEAMEQLKQALTSAPVLILPDPERAYVIEAEASDQAVGAVLMQDQGMACNQSPISARNYTGQNSTTRYTTRRPLLSSSPSKRRDAISRDARQQSTRTIAA